MAQPRHTKPAEDGRAVTARQSKELQVNEDLDFQRRDWLAQRVGWGVLTLLLLAALSGLTGSGPLSGVTRSDGQHFTLEYDRFVRHGARTIVTFRAAPEAIIDGRVRIVIDRLFFVANDVQRLVPEPTATRGRGDALEFVYEVAPGDGLTARWTVEPEKIGSHTTPVRLSDGPAVEISQFTYP